MYRVSLAITEELGYHSHASNAMHDSMAPIESPTNSMDQRVSSGTRARRSPTHRTMASTSGKRVVHVLD
jgi:hypothetical protein